MDIFHNALPNNYRGGVCSWCGAVDQGERRGSEVFVIHCVINWAVLKTKKIMIQLNELSKIALGKAERKEQAAEREEQARVKREREYNEKQEKQYQEAIKNLEQRLKDAALDGKNNLRVAHFSAFIGGNVSERLHKKRGSYGNYYVAWNKTIFESDVIECMQGNLKRVYDYLQENGLNPKVDYWIAGGGMDEGFELVVQW